VRHHLVRHRVEVAEQRLDDTVALPNSHLEDGRLVVDVAAAEVGRLDVDSAALRLDVAAVDVGRGRPTATKTTPTA